LYFSCKRKNYLLLLLLLLVPVLEIFWSRNV
jgi:hypothetical protein